MLIKRKTQNAKRKTSATKTLGGSANYFGGKTKNLKLYTLVLRF
jgi:hypothetical protein